MNPTENIMNNVKNELTKIKSKTKDKSILDSIDNIEKSLGL